jgi:hypothetical protein
MRFEGKKALPLTWQRLFLLSATVAGEWVDCPPGSDQHIF